MEQHAYGHPHDQGDGFFEIHPAAVTPAPIPTTLTIDQAQTQLVILADKIKHAPRDAGNERWKLISEAARLMRLLPKQKPVNVLEHSQLGRAAEVLTLIDVVPEIGHPIEMVELLRVKNAPARWLCTKTGRQYHLHKSASRRSPRRGKH